MFRVSDYPKKISIGLYEKECNLKCPKCLVHSPYMKRGREIKGNLGSMPIKSVLKIFDEIKDYKPMVGSSFWSEPLFRKDLFKKFFIEAKRRGLPTQTSTNGLLLTEELADFMVNHLDIITISIDAFTKETLLKTRGTDKLNVIRNAVLLLLKKRESLYPRITVNFTSE